MEFSEEEKRIILNFKTHQKSANLTKIYEMVRPGEKPTNQAFFAILEILKENENDIEYITEYDLEDRILQMEQSGVSLLETFRTLLSEGYVITENYIRKIRGKENHERENSKQVKEKKERKTLEVNEFEEYDLSKIIDEIKAKKIKCTKAILARIVYNLRKGKKADGREYENENKTRTYEEIREWLSDNLCINMTVNELYMIFDRENKIQMMQNRKLAKEILNLATSRNATLEQIQKMAEYYNVNLEEVINSLEQR